MSEENQLPVVFNNAQRDIILMQTPLAEVKSRPGRGGQSVSYVEVGYVVETLNRAFGFDWDFEVVQHTLLAEANEVCVLGRLTVRANGKAIVKQQFGGSDVKTLRNSQTPVSLADDFKAAASDALKKCASLLGVAHDVYRGQAEQPGPGGDGSETTGDDGRQQKKATQRKKKPAHWIDQDNIRRRFWAWTKGTLKLSENEVHTALGVKSVRDFGGSMNDAKAALEAFAMDTPTENEEEG